MCTFERGAFLNVMTIVQRVWPYQRFNQPDQVASLKLVRDIVLIDL